MEELGQCRANGMLNLTNRHQAVRGPTRVGFALCVATTMLLCGGVVNTVGSQPAAAQTQTESRQTSKATPKKKRDKKATSANSGQAVANADAFPLGIAASTANRHNEAIKHFSDAISSGKLKNRDLARALYLRGASYKATKQVALAIADLTNSLYMRNGLTGEDRKKALALRAASYAEGGLSDQGQQDAASIAATAAPTGTQSGTARRTTAAQAGPGEAVGGDWRASTKSAPASRSTAARVAPPAAASWSSATRVNEPRASASTARARKTRSEPITTTASVANKASSKPVPRGVMVQAAAVRSESDAQAMAKKAQQAVGGRHETYVDKAVVGNMGSFYRVLVGPYQKEADSRSTCASLRKNGLDCLVIRN